MSKKSPSLRRGRGARAESFLSRADAGYWLQRLYRNTYTRHGRRAAVRSWAVKIQRRGLRRTFSLQASDRRQAAAEALEIYQRIVAGGWQGVERGGARRGAGRSRARLGGVAGREGAVEYWKRKLVKRPYPALLPEVERDFAVYIEHAGASHYFPLGTNVESEAANKAAQIHGVIREKGWAAARERYSRELALAMRWLDNPVAWTYTTLHTWKKAPLGPRKRGRGEVGWRVAIVEPDRGLRLSLGSYLSGQEGVSSCDEYEDVEEMAGGVCSRPADLVLVNSCFREVTSNAWLSEGRNPVAFAEARSTVKAGRRQPIVGVFYSVFADADQLFKCTPGRAIGYVLKRTPLNDLLAPIAGAAGPLTHKLVALKVRKYFQELVLTMPAAPTDEGIIKLTPREREVLSQLAQGRVTKEIAGGLGISSWTVNGHVKSILEKLRVHTRTEAVVRYLEPIG